MRVTASYLQCTYLVMVRRGFSLPLAIVFLTRASKILLGVEEEVANDSVAIAHGAWVGLAARIR